MGSPQAAHFGASTLREKQREHGAHCVVTRLRMATGACQEPTTASTQGFVDLGSLLKYEHYSQLLQGHLATSCSPENKDEADHLLPSQLAGMAQQAESGRC